MLFVCINCRWFSYKEIDKEEIKYWRQIPHVMCEMIKYIPPTFFFTQEH